MIEFPPDEEWMELAEDPRYLVSTHGRMYSTRTRTILKPQVAGRTGDHHPRVQWRISSRGRQTWIGCARAVLHAFVGPEPPGHVARVRDGDPWNVALTNVEWTPRLTLDQVQGLSAAGNAARREARGG